MVKRKQDGVLPDIIFADDPGMGKTAATLKAIQTLADLEIKRLSSDLASANAPRKYRPNIILCPSSPVIDRWVEDAQSLIGSDGVGGVNVMVWYGSKQSTPDRHRRRFLIDGTLEELEKHLATLDSTSPETLRVCIVTTYQTWMKRVLGIVEKGRGGEDEEDDEELGLNEGPDNDDEAEQIFSGEDTLYRDITGRDYRSQVAKRFEICVCDEAHNLRNRTTLIHTAVATTLFKCHWFITATPMMNKMLDMHGFLSLVWKPKWKLQLGDNIDYSQIYEQDFVPDESTYDNNDDDSYGLKKTLEQGYKLYLLDPLAFIRQSKNGHFTPATARNILPPIIEQIQLRRTMASQIDLGPGRDPVFPGEAIPHYTIKTLELEFTKEQKAVYEPIYKRLVTGLYNNSDDGSNTIAEGHVNMAAHRRLCHATFNPGLETMFTKSKANFLANDIDKWTEEDHDRGMTRYFLQTRAGPEYLPYRDRPSFGHYLTNLSPKLQYLCMYVMNACVEKGGRVLVFCDWPATQYNVDGALTNYGITVGIV